MSAHQFKHSPIHPLFSSPPDSSFGERHPVPACTTTIAAANILAATKTPRIAFTYPSTAIAFSTPSSSHTIAGLPNNFLTNSLLASARPPSASNPFSRDDRSSLTKTLPPAADPKPPASPRKVAMSDVMTKWVLLGVRWRICARV